MKKFDVQIALEGVREARENWDTRFRKFNADVEYVMKRLINEAAVNYMSAEEVAKHSGLTTKRVRMLMRGNGLDPKGGRRMLSKQAAETLANNAALMGIEPHEVDLMSPLAYLPMGRELKTFLETNQGVTELPEDSYEHAKARISAAIQIGLSAEEGNPNLDLPDLTDDQINWLAAWLASEGVK